MQSGVKGRRAARTPRRARGVGGSRGPRAEERESTRLNSSHATNSHCGLFFFNDTATTEIYTLSLHDALPIFRLGLVAADHVAPALGGDLLGPELGFLARGPRDAERGEGAAVRQHHLPDQGVGALAGTEDV